MNYTAANQKKRRPLVWVVAFYAMGILVQSLSEGLLFAAGVSAVLFLFLSFILNRDKPFISTMLLLLTFCCAGIIHAQSKSVLSPQDVSLIARFYRYKPVQVKGRIISEVTRKNFFKGRKTSFILELNEVKEPWGAKPYQGKILVNVFKDAAVDYGDVIALEGKLHKPFNFSSQDSDDKEHFSYPAYLRHRGIYWIISVKKEGRLDVLEKQTRDDLRSRSIRLKSKFKSILQESLSPNEAGLMQAILLGERSYVPSHIRELFSQTGTAHILAISGLHIGVVAGLFLILLKLFPVGRRVQLIITIILLTGFAYLTGGRPSVVRATIMTVVFLAGFIVERDTDPLNTLALAAFIILLLNPFNLFDVGFQLSFICVWSIFILSTPIEQVISYIFRCPQNRWIRSTIQAFSVSAAVTAGVTGLIAFYFNIISPVTLVSNLVVVPVLSVVVVLGLGLLISAVILPVFTIFFTVCLKTALNFMVAAVYLFAQVPLAYFYLSGTATWHLGVYYGIFLVFFWFLRFWANKLTKP